MQYEDGYYVSNDTMSVIGLLIILIAVIFIIAFTFFGDKSRDNYVYEADTVVEGSTQYEVNN